MANDLEERTVLVIPCSGIGKVHGLLSREAAYLVTDELASSKTDTICLALLVKGDHRGCRSCSKPCLHHHRRLPQSLRAKECRDGRRARCEGLSGGGGVQSPSRSQARERVCIDRRRMVDRPGYCRRCGMRGDRNSSRRGGDSVSAELTKVGIISCSGESIPEGTIARLATRRVLELLRPDVTVTLCLPLFLAGNEGERNFARTHPTITVDGCAKQCAKWGTEQHSGPVNAAIVVSDLLGTEVAECHRSSRDTSEVDKTAVWAVAERIASEVDNVLAEATPVSTYCRSQQCWPMCLLQSAAGRNDPDQRQESHDNRLAFDF